MNLKQLQIVACAIASIAFTSFATQSAHAAVVKDGDVVAIVGDSITEGRQYSSLIEDYLLMCQPAKVRVMQFGWSGETIGGLNNRMVDVLAMKPTVVTLCYGMNDGRYQPINDDIKNTFHAGLLKAVQTLQQSGAKVIVGSPGCVDANAFVRPTITAADYNVNLGTLKNEASAVAQQTGSQFADVFSPMFGVMGPAKTKYGNDYSIAGTDGVHPRANGGLVMAYAFLKGLGFDGNVGTLYVDMNDHSAKTFGPHKFVKADGNTFTFESSAYPFCFSGEPKDAGGTTGMLEFISFNADLNRFTLTVAGPAKAYKVTWGKTSKEFSADALKAGVNLAAEFIDNPFVEPFMAVHQKVMDKEGSEILLLKQLLHSVNATHQFMPDHEAELNAVARNIPGAQQKLADEVAKLVTPVTHTISIEPIN